MFRVYTERQSSYAYLFELHVYLLVALMCIHGQLVDGAVGAVGNAVEPSWGLKDADVKGVGLETARHGRLLRADSFSAHGSGGWWVPGRE